MLCRSWQAESMDSGCSNSAAFTAPFSECAEGVCGPTGGGGRCDQPSSRLSAVKVVDPHHETPPPQAARMPF